MMVVVDDDDDDDEDVLRSDSDFVAGSEGGIRKDH